MPEAFNSPLLPSADDLDKVVEEQELVAHQQSLHVVPTPSQNNVTTVNKLNRKEGQCFNCENTAINFCKHCGQEFCSDHKSKYATGICCLCIGPDNVGLQYEELVDEETDANGVLHTHRGRRIKLIGEGWPNAMQMIDELTDEGLEIFIAERQRLLKEAVALSEYHRITLSVAEFTKEYNRKSKIERLRRRREELQRQGAIRLGGKTVQLGAQPQKRRVKTDEEKAAEALGFTVEQFRAFKSFMAKPK